MLSLVSIDYNNKLLETDKLVFCIAMGRVKHVHLRFTITLFYEWKGKL